MEKIDGRRARGDSTRRAIAAQAARDATIWGLESTTLGTLASRAVVSKSGILTLFGTREAVLEAAVHSARDTYRAEVLSPAETAAPGVDRLNAVIDAWESYARRHVFPGGCFLAKASVEYAGQTGVVSDAVRAFKREWLDYLTHHFLRAGARDPLGRAMQLDAVLMGGMSTWKLLGEDRVLEAAVASAHELAGRG